MVGLTLLSKEVGRMHHQKRTYPTYRAALKTLLGATKRRGTPLRIYPCKECEGFHLTKQPTRRGRQPA